MLHVGLTGNIASGKSTVAARFAAAGAVVLDADRFAREAVAPGTPGFERVLARFGDTLRMADGTLDRAALGRIVFADADARRDLEAIVHPEVARLRAAAVAAAAADGATIIVSDVPLLFEAGLRAEFDVVVLVDAPESIRHARLTQLRGLPAADARAMMDSQGDPSQKRPLADWVIVNDGSREHLHAQTDRVWDALVGRAASP